MLLRQPLVRAAACAAVLGLLLACACAQLVLQSTLLVPTLGGSGTQEEAPHRLLLFAQDEPVDVLEGIRKQYGASRAWRHSTLVQVCQRQNVRCSRDRPLVFSTRITDQAGGTLGELIILEDEEPVDALAHFSMRYGLSRSARLQVLSAICEKIPCQRHRSRIFHQRILGDRGEEAPVGVLEIYDDAEPIDQIYRFVVDKQLQLPVMDHLLSVVCNSIPCERSTPMVFSRDISTADGRMIRRLEVPLGQEPADIVYDFGLRFGLDKSFRQQLLRVVCAEKYVKCERMSTVVFEAPIVGENSTSIGTLRIEEDQEVADAVYRFACEHELPRELHVALLRQLCSREGLLCTRGQALLRSMPISDGQGGSLGIVQVFEGQEPADVAYDFAKQHGLSADAADQLVDVLCGLAKDTPPGPHDLPVKCSRFYPVVFAVPVSANNGSRLGVLEVLTNDEPADAVARFGNKHGLGKEEKANLLKAICQNSGLPCNRDQGMIYQAVYTLPDGRRERLDFMDGVEPTDLIYDYGKLRSLTLQQRKKFLVEVCNEPRRRPNCTRAEPMLISIPVWENADKKMGDLEILEGQDPIDMVYAFMDKHDLFQTAPLNTTLKEVVCNSTRVACPPHQPRRILFTMQATYYGISHTLQYVQQESDWICESLPYGGKTCVHYMEVLSKEFCETHMSDWEGCETRILEAVRQQLELYEERMWRGKDLYAKLGLVKTASKDEIDAAYNRLVKRFNNETEPQKYEKLREAYATLSDPEDKYYYDLPCVKLFGCLCGKRKKDGSLTFTTD